MISESVLNELAEQLQKQFGFASVTDLDKKMADVLRTVAVRQQSGKPTFSWSKMIRGLRALDREPLNHATAEEDVKFVRALNTSQTPGSYVVPNPIADELIGMLAQSSTLRQAGARVWPMANLQKLQVPIGLASPTFTWAAQNSQTSASDPNLGQIAFDLLDMRALVAIPNSLIRASVPAFDQVLQELLAKGAGNFEDAAFHSTTDVSGGPKSIYANSGITSLTVGNAVSGGNLAYSDLLAVLQKSAEVHAAPPFAFFMSPRTWFGRVLNMLDSSSRPIAIPTQATGLYPQVAFTLFGWPVYLSSNISNSEVVASGSSQSHIVFTNASQYCHIAQDQAGLGLQTSTERFFDSDQTAIKIVNRIDFALAPAAGTIVLKGIN